jgi:hypothetical protein
MSNEDALTRAELDEIQCGVPACTAEFPHARLTGLCHAGQPVNATYLEGVLVLRCSVCHAYVCTVLVAAKPDRVGASGARVYLVQALRSGNEGVFSDAVQAELYAVTGGYDLTAITVDQWPDQEAWAHGG